MIILELYDYFNPENARTVHLEVSKTVEGEQVTSDVLLTDCDIVPLDDYTANIFVYDNDDTCEIVYTVKSREYIEEKRFVELLHELFTDMTIQLEC